MVAAAFTANLSFRTQNGRAFSIRATASDVAAAAWVFPDGATTLQLPSGEGIVSLVDVSLAPAAGTDTTYSELYVNGAQAYQLQHAPNLYTAYSRAVMQAPINMRPGAAIRFIQRA